MEILAHSDVRLTMNVYTHLFDESRRGAGESMDRWRGEPW